MQNQDLSPVNTAFYSAGKIFGCFCALCFCIIECAGPVVWEQLIARFPQCSFYRTIGFYCPGCGGTHAVISLLRFRLWESFCCHPFVLYGAVIYIIFMTGCFCRKHLRNCTIQIIPIEISIYIGIAVIFIQWIVKNFYLILYRYI